MIWSSPVRGGKGVELERGRGSDWKEKAGRRELTWFLMRAQGRRICYVGEVLARSGVVQSYVVNHSRFGESSEMELPRRSSGTIQNGN